MKFKLLKYLNNADFLALFYKELEKNDHLGPIVSKKSLLKVLIQNLFD